MTKEELEQKANEFIKGIEQEMGMCMNEFSRPSVVEKLSKFASTIIEDLERELEDAKKHEEKERLCGKFRTRITDLEKWNKELDEALITSTKNNIERQKIIDSLTEELEKQLHQCEENYARDFRQFEALKQKQFANLEKQIEKMKCCGNCLYRGECDLSGYEECKNFDKWELVEK